MVHCGGSLAPSPDPPGSQTHQPYVNERTVTLPPINGPAPQLPSADIQMEPWTVGGGVFFLKDAARQKTKLTITDIQMGPWTGVGWGGIFLKGAARQKTKLTKTVQIIMSKKRSNPVSDRNLKKSRSSDATIPCFNTLVLESEEKLVKHNVKS